MEIEGAEPVGVSIDFISDFMFASTEVEPADVILVPGGSHRQLMEAAADLYHQGLAPMILPSGGKNSKLVDHDSEWQFLKDVAISLGVPAVAILREDKAKHTFENASLSRHVLEKQGLTIKKAILVCKTFHARRALLTYGYCFPPGVEFFVRPVVDQRGITKDNWYLSRESSRVVMEEVWKIGSYFKDKIESLVGVSG